MALEIGWHVLGMHGEELLVTRLQDTGNDDVVYNMRVEDWHTYFVGEDRWGFGVWAHNLSCEEKTEIADNLFNQQKLTKQQAEAAMLAMNLSDGQIRSVKDIARQHGWLAESNRPGRRSTLTTREQVERVVVGFENEGMQLVNVSKSVRTGMTEESVRTVEGVRSPDITFLTDDGLKIRISTVDPLRRNSKYSIPDVARELPNAQAIASAMPDVPMVMIVKGAIARDSVFCLVSPDGTGVTRLLANSFRSLINELRTIQQMRLKN